MSNDNLVLTEHAIKRHAKRLQRTMQQYHQQLTLSESQQLFSKILGFNDWNHLSTILNSNKTNEKNEPIKQLPSAINIRTRSESEKDTTERHTISLKNAAQSFDMYCRNGDIISVERYLQSTDKEIQNYIKIHSHHFFKIAAEQNQIYICKLLASLPYCQLQDMDYEEIVHILNWTYKKELDVFNYIFYESNLPKRLTAKDTNYILGTLVAIQNVATVEKFIHDPRIEPLLDINHGSPSGIFYNILVNDQHCLNLAKYFIKNYQMTIQEDNVFGLSRIKNMKLIKYLLIHTDSKKYLQTYKKSPMPNIEKNDDFLKNIDNIIFPKHSFHDYLDETLLSRTIYNDNLTFLNYLLTTEDLNIKVSNYNFLALEHACYYCNIPALKLLLKQDGSKIFLKQHAQRIFNKLSNSLIGDYNDYLPKQYEMCKYLLEKYDLTVESVTRAPENTKLYIYLTNCMAKQKKL